MDRKKAGRKRLGSHADKTAPAVTKEKVLAIMHLREGELVDPVAVAAVVNLYPCQVSELLRSHVPLFRPVRCRKCGSLLESVPCVACGHRKEYPMYITAIERCVSSEADDA